MPAQPRSSPPLVSVNIPTFNRRELLDRCLRSVFRQTLQDYEIVVVDDGSTDGTRESLATHVGPHFIYHWQPHVGLLPAVRNAALRLSRGKYVAVLDSDDEWDPSKLERQVDLMERDRLVLSWTDARTEGPGASRENSFLHHPADHYLRNTIPRLFASWFILVPTVMFLRETADSAGGFNEAFPAAGDAEFVLRMISAHSFGMVHAPLLTRHRHGEHLSSRYAVESYEEMLTLADRYRDAGALRPGVYRRVVSHLLYRMAVEDGIDPGRSRTALARSSRIYPFNLRAVVRWMLS